MRYTMILTLAALFLAVPGFAQQAHRDIDNIDNIDNIGNRDINKGGLMSGRLPDLNEEIAIGRQASLDLEKTVTLLADRVVVDYVNSIGQNIARNSDAKVPITIRVIQSDEINAFALPGGFVYVNTGLILATGNEAELAGMLGHAVAHIAARHAVEQAQRAALVMSTVLPVTVFAGGIPGMAAEQARSIGIPLTFVHFSRAAEKEADWLGLQYMYKAGYAPEAMVSFFQKVRSREAVRVPASTMFATHPLTDDRIKDAERNIREQLPARAQSILTTTEFQVIKDRLTEK